MGTISLLEGLLGLMKSVAAVGMMNFKQTLSTFNIESLSIALAAHVVYHPSIGRWMTCSIYCVEQLWKVMSPILHASVR